jgi:hypothetical protein
MTLHTPESFLCPPGVLAISGTFVCLRPLHPGSMMSRGVSERVTPEVVSLSCQLAVFSTSRHSRVYQIDTSPASNSVLSKIMGSVVGDICLVYSVFMAWSTAIRPTLFSLAVLADGLYVDLVTGERHAGTKLLIHGSRADLATGVRLAREERGIYTVYLHGEAQPRFRLYSRRSQARRAVV